MSNSVFKYFPNAVTSGCHYAGIAVPTVSSYGSYELIENSQTILTNFRNFEIRICSSLLPRCQGRTKASSREFQKELVRVSSAWG